MARPQPLGHDALRLEAWPAADRTAYERACIPGSPFDDRGLAAEWRPASHRALTGAYARWLGFLIAGGHALEAEPPPDRVTGERVRGYIRFLTPRCAPVTVSSYLGQLYTFVHALWPERDWRWLLLLQARHHRMADPVRNKAARIVPQTELLRLGCELMRDAGAMPMPPDLRAGPRHPALLYRDGLMIALLAMRPLRQVNFLGLQLHRHLRREGEAWWIEIPGEECKTHTRLSMPFPAVLVPALELYLELYRPRLLEMRGPRNPACSDRPPGNHLWISRCGTPMTAGAQQKALARHTRPRFGHHVNAHLFRDCAATSLGDEDPEHVRLAADLLGHRSFRTTEANYMAAGTRAALRRHQLGVQERRCRARRGRAPRPESRP
jgi:integrase